MSTPSGVSFADLGVPADLVAVLDRQGIQAPFAIQAATLPDALAGRDVLGRAPTGSGKTLAFGLPMVAGLRKAKPKRPTGLILSPTRELAEQIRRELAPLAKAKDRTLLTVYGGVGFRDQLTGLRRGADLLVACPGRLQDLLDQGAVSLDAVRSVVVDEADRMADMGFLPAVRQLLDLTSPQRQTVLFSATLGPEVNVLTKNYQNDPVTHEVGEVEPDLSLVEHRFIKTEQRVKVPLGAQTIDAAGPTIVFCRTRHGVDRVARQLKNAGVKAGWIHGGRSQNQRDAALKAFTTGRVQALVATDVAARGIHVDGVACVIHFDPPEDDKAYVHRSGRTARAGAGGTVVSFVNSDQVKDARKLQKQLGLPADFEEVPEEIEPLPGPNTSRRGPSGGSDGAGNREARSRKQSNRGQSESRRQSDGARHSDSGRQSDDDRQSMKGRESGSDRTAGSGKAKKSPQQRKDGRPRAGAGDGSRARNNGSSHQHKANGSGRSASTSSKGTTGSSDKRATSEQGESESFNDWTPRPKRSRSGPKRGPKAGSGRSSTKRTGKPRPKNKAASRAAASGSSATGSAPASGGGRRGGGTSSNRGPGRTGSGKNSSKGRRSPKRG